MCLGVPGKIIKKEKNTALVDFSGNKREVSIRVLPGVKVGDYILVHAGLALAKVDKEKAKEAEKLISEILDEVKETS